MISMTTTSVMRFVPADTGMSCSRRLMRTWRAWSPVMVGRCSCARTLRTARANWVMDTIRLAAPTARPAMAVGSYWPPLVQQLAQLATGAYVTTRDHTARLGKLI